MDVRVVAILVLLAGCDPDAYAPGAERVRATERRARELAAQLETLPGVAHASVVLDVPVADPLAPPSPTPPAASPRAAPRASIVLALGPGADAAAAEDAARRAAAATVDGLALDAIAVSSAGPPAERVVAVGPFRVAEGSRRPLLAALATGLAVIAGLAIWIALLAYRRAPG